MTNTIDPGFNIEDVHCDIVDELFDENQLGGSAAERRAIAGRWHQLDAWPDFPEAYAGCGDTAPASPSRSLACR